MTEWNFCNLKMHFSIHYVHVFNVHTNTWNKTKHFKQNNNVYHAKERNEIEYMQCEAVNY